MTNEDAKTMSLVLWGDDGSVEYDSDQKIPYRVYCLRGWPWNWKIGRGLSWEAAFADAERRKTKGGDR